MNTTLRHPTPINTASYPSEEPQLLREKSENIRYTNKPLA